MRVRKNPTRRRVAAVAKPDAESLERQFNAAMEEAETGASLEAARRIYAEFERDGDPAASGLVHRSFELCCEAEFLSGESYRGASGYARWREQIDTKGLLFKVTVMGSRVRERQQDAAASGPGTKAST